MPKFLKGNQEAKKRMAKLRQLRGNTMIKMMQPMCSCKKADKKAMCTCGV